MSAYCKIYIITLNQYQITSCVKLLWILLFSDEVNLTKHKRPIFTFCVCYILYYTYFRDELEQSLINGSNKSFIECTSIFLAVAAGMLCETGWTGTKPGFLFSSPVVCVSQQLWDFLICGFHWDHWATDRRFSLMLADSFWMFLLLYPQHTGEVNSAVCIH